MANKKSMNNRNNTDNIATGIHTGHNIDNKESNEDYIVKSLATLWEVKYFLVWLQSCDTLVYIYTDLKSCSLWQNKQEWR